MKQKTAWLWVVLRIFVGLVFAYAGFSKLVEPIENFRGAITEYQVIPYALVPWVALIMPWLEILLGAFMILGFAPRYSSFGAAMLALGFLLVIGASDMLLDSGTHYCGCFGSAGPIQLSVRQIFALDLFNLAVGLKLSSLKHHPFSLDSILRPSS